MPGGVRVRISEEQVFDLMADLVEFASTHGLPQTAVALEGALDAYLQDRGLAPKALPAPAPVAAPPRDGGGTAGEARVRPEVLAAITAPDPVLDAAHDTALEDAGLAAFHSRRAMPRPRRLHLLPTQRVPG
jgi:hypothetical protein